MGPISGFMTHTVLGMVMLAMGELAVPLLVRDLATTVRDLDTIVRDLATAGRDLATPVSQALLRRSS